MKFWKNVLLQRFNANEPEFMLRYYQTIFHKRVLSENESLHAYAFDLKLLAYKAYPNQFAQSRKYHYLADCKRLWNICMIWTCVVSWSKFYRRGYRHCIRSWKFSLAAILVARTINTMFRIKPLFCFCKNIRQVVTNWIHITPRFTEQSLIRKIMKIYKYKAHPTHILLVFAMS